MSYTLLRVTERGVLFYEGHEERLAAAREAFRSFARTAQPGVYAVFVHDGALAVERREGSRLHDGMPVRVLASPVANRCGAFGKPAPPSPYDAVRVVGLATLLTSADGLEIYEACSAAVIAWDGAHLVVPPRDRPRVASVAVAALCAALPVIERPIEVSGREPLLLVNAVAGTCAVAAGRPQFPARGLIDSVFAATRIRPAS